MRGRRWQRVLAELIPIAAQTRLGLPLRDPHQSPAVRHEGMVPRYLDAMRLTRRVPVRSGIQCVLVSRGGEILEVGPGRGRDRGCETETDQLYQDAQCELICALMKRGSAVRDVAFDHIRECAAGLPHLVRL